MPPFDVWSDPLNIDRVDACSGALVPNVAQVTPFLTKLVQFIVTFQKPHTFRSILADFWARLKCKLITFAPSQGFLSPNAVLMKQQHENSP